jgi:hypothetical protein
MERLRIFLALLALSAATCSARAALPLSPSSPAESGTGSGHVTEELQPAAGPSVCPVFAGFVSSLSSRGRAIQVSIVLMCVALFILIKKFSEAGPARRPPSAVPGKKYREIDNGPLTTDAPEEPRRATVQEQHHRLG